MNTATKTILTLESVLKQMPVERKAQTREEKEQAANELAKRLAEKAFLPYTAAGRAMVFGCTALAWSWQNGCWKLSTRRNSGTWLTLLNKPLSSRMMGRKAEILASGCSMML